MRISDDDRLNPSHVSLYLALFQFWNMNRFQNPISINRSEVMRISKIGSKSTYHRCINELSDWNYLEYRPSKNPMKGSAINMYIFGTSSGTSGDQVVDFKSPKNEQVVGQVLVPSINSINNTNNNKTSKGELHSPQTQKRKTQKRFSPPTLEEVIEFFNEKKASTVDAEKYFNHFQSNGWKVGGRTKMKDWKAAARNWIMRSNEFKKINDPTSSRLNVNESKNYDIPL
ncbi:MAG: transcriptional regulator [Fluviicola sp.]|nr:MAG: transcriptional regulator [Fluviicola sp.]